MIIARVTYGTSASGGPQFAFHGGATARGGLESNDDASSTRCAGNRQCLQTVLRFLGGAGCRTDLRTTIAAMRRSTANGSATHRVTRTTTCKAMVVGEVTAASRRWTAAS